MPAADAVRAGAHPAHLTGSVPLPLLDSFQLPPDVRRWLLEGRLAALRASQTARRTVWSS